MPFILSKINCHLLSLWKSESSSRISESHGGFLFCSVLTVLVDIALERKSLAWQSDELCSRQLRFLYSGYIRVKTITKVRLAVTGGKVSYRFPSNIFLILTEGAVTPTKGQNLSSMTEWVNIPATCSDWLERFCHCLPVMTFLLAPSLAQDWVVETGHRKHLFFGNWSISLRVSSQSSSRNTVQSQYKWLTPTRSSDRHDKNPMRTREAESCSSGPERNEFAGGCLHVTETASTN